MCCVGCKVFVVQEGTQYYCTKKNECVKQTVTTTANVLKIIYNPGKSALLRVFNIISKGKHFNWEKNKCKNVWEKEV